jgi:adenylate kinase family enzyme
MNTSPLRLIVMGVSGCGKTTLAAALGEHLVLDMVDGDDLHLKQNGAKTLSRLVRLSNILMKHGEEPLKYMRQDYHS